MKKLIFILSILVLFSCEEEGILTKNVEQVPVDEELAVLKYSGTFETTSGISGEGKTKIFLEGNQYKLILEDYSIENGPDLKVYLSKTNSPDDFVNLGNLNPSATYLIPSSVNMTEYPFVLIHCQQYNHLFAIAQLVQN